MKKYKKTILCASAALCLLGAALTGAVDVSVKTQAETLTFIEESLLPVWEGETAYYEPVLPVANEYGGIDPITLLYPIEEIISVQNAEMTVTYQAGVDYAVSKGRLIIADDGNIPVLSYTEFHPYTGEAGFESNEGGYVCFHEGAWFHSKQIVVTYKHTDYDGYIPEGKSHLLPNTMQKLSNRENVDMLVLGDSISVGANSSAFTDVSPYLPTYPELFKTKLESAYGATVNLTNPSVGGKGIDWGIGEIDGILSNMADCDLAVLAFGMNDGSMSGAMFAQKANRLISAIQEKFPQAEVLLVATMLPNPQAKNFYLNQKSFADALIEKCEKQGVAVVNMTAMHSGLLARKGYADMTGNNVNHPNDYLARVYAQTLFATLQDKAVIPDEIPDETSEEISEESASEQSSVTSVPNEQNQRPTASFFGLLLGGCTATMATIHAGIIAVLSGTAILKKKKDE